METDPRESTPTPLYLMKSYWLAIYKDLFGTSFPNIEPWVLQGYTNKPTWWDDMYADPTHVRKWSTLMWGNIQDGIIPTNKNYPEESGWVALNLSDVGNGLPNQIIKKFSYIPVNTSSVSINGIEPDGLLLPFMDASGFTGFGRPLFDKNDLDVVSSPEAPANIMENSFSDYRFINSTIGQVWCYILNYFKNPLGFIAQCFGYENTPVDCLLINENSVVDSCKNTLFHGTIYGDDKIKAYGLNEIIVSNLRKNQSSEELSNFFALWSGWEMKLAYDFKSNIINNDVVVKSEYFESSKNDYKIVNNIVSDSGDFITPVTVSLTSVPSKYNKLREFGIGWGGVISSVSDEFKYYGQQNYPVCVKTSSLLEVDLYKLANYDSVIGGVNACYFITDILDISSLTGLDENLTYTLNYQINSNVFSHTIDGFKYFGDVIDELNFLMDEAEVVLVDGVLEIRCLETGDTISGVSGTLITTLSISPLYRNTPLVFTNKLYVSGNVVSRFKPKNRAVIIESTDFNGEFDIVDSYYDQSGDFSVINVRYTNDISPSSKVVDGYIHPIDRLSIHSEWIDGDEVSIYSTGIEPSPLSINKVYNLKK